MAGSDFVQSVDRAIEILHKVSGSDTGLTLGEIAEAMELKVPTTHNLVRTLAAREYLTRCDENRYRLGDALLDLAARHGERSAQGRIGASLVELTQIYPDATVTYAEIEAAEVVVRLRVSPDRPGILQRPGNRPYVLYVNATGLAALAFADPETVLALRERHPFYELGLKTWDSLERLYGFLADMRLQGYATPPVREPEIFRAAAPVLDRSGSLRGLVGISLVLPEDNREDSRNQMRDSLLEATSRLSATFTGTLQGVSS